MDRTVDRIWAEALTDLTNYLKSWTPEEYPTLADVEAIAEIMVAPFFEMLLYSHATGAAVVQDFITPYLFADQEDEISFLTTRLAVRQAVKRAAYSVAEWDLVTEEIAGIACKLSAYTGVEIYGTIQESIAAAVAEGATIAEWSKTGIIESLGILKDNPYYLENVFRTNTATYYAAGKWQALQRPAARDTIAALEFIAVLDSRTTVICDRLSGTIAAVDDPLWDRYYPPNHYMCRSTVGFVSKYEPWTKTVRNDLEPPLDGFDRNPGKDFGALPKDVIDRIENSGVKSWADKRTEEIRNEIKRIRSE